MVIRTFDKSTRAILARSVNDDTFFTLSQCSHTKSFPNGPQVTTNVVSKMFPVKNNLKASKKPFQKENKDLCLTSRQLFQNRTSALVRLFSIGSQFFPPLVRNQIEAARSRKWIARTYRRTWNDNFPNQISRSKIVLDCSTSSNARRLRFGKAVLFGPTGYRPQRRRQNNSHSVCNAFYALFVFAFPDTHIYTHTHNMTFGIVHENSTEYELLDDNFTLKECVDCFERFQITWTSLHLREWNSIGRFLEKISLFGISTVVYRHMHRNVNLANRWMIRSEIV